MPFTTDIIAAQQVQEHLKALYELIHDIEKQRQQSEQGVNSLLKTQQQQHQSQEEKNLYQSKLKSCIADAEKEEEIIRKALQRITDIRNIKNERRIQTRLTGRKQLIRRGPWMKMLLNSAQTLPLFISRKNEKPPPLCGAIPPDPGYIAKIGDMVVASVKIPQGDWILAEVVSYNHSTNKYEIDDILAEQNQKGRHVLSARRVVPLPLMRANPETDPQALYPEGTVVMALYPSTTCFYKGIVNKPPATHTDEYEILFEDANYKQGYSPPLTVAQRYVIAIKQKTTQT